MIWLQRRCIKAGRTDLIGFDEKCLIRPRKLKSEKSGKPQARTQSGRTKPKYSGNSAGNSNGAKKKSTGRKPIRNVHKKEAEITKCWRNHERIYCWKNEANQRLDKYLHKLLKEASNGFLYKMLRNERTLP